MSGQGVALGLVWLVALVNLTLTLAIIRQLNLRHSNDVISGLKPGTEAPNFQATTMTGTAVSMSDFRSRPSLFVFVSPNCGPCRAMLPRLGELQRLGTNAGSYLVLFSSGTAQATADMLDRTEFAGTVVVAAPETEIFRKFSLVSTPHYAYIVQGIVRERGVPDDQSPTWLSIIQTWEAEAKRSLVAVQG
jgi:peroxiredoxin